VPLSAPQIPHDIIRSWTRTAAEGSQRVTAWAMARPSIYLSIYLWLCSPFVGPWPLFQFLNPIHSR
jgi:hypothetical protein